VGTDTWFAGKRTCVRYLARHALGAPGDWRMLATSANGQPAVAAYLRGDDGTHGAWGVAVLDLDAAGISRIVVFGDRGLVARFGLPPVHPG
jgi:RNA polymerase sigma-70 factor (ECF subfamily)